MAAPEPIPPGMDRIVHLFDTDDTAGGFLAEDGDGGFAGAVWRMAREIDRLREAGEVEIARVNEPATLERIRAKHSPLPERAQAADPEPVDLIDFSSRDRFREDADPAHPLTAALRELVRLHGLAGAVLLSFDGDRVGINSSSPNDKFGAVMERLGDLILVRLDDGDFDAALGGKHGA